jgi:hypothetical protein
MYRGFNLTLDFEKDFFYQKGRDLNAVNKLAVKRTLDSFISPDGSINGSKMQSNWFPLIDADIFISHSHRDEKMAITLAGWLNENFGISTFIDSCIWGYSNDLLRQIDNKHCLNPSGETYSYEKRNNSTSHVHMMLSTALNMMIDKTECLFFLNTPNSITTKEIISQTESPWIYSEISMSELIRRKKLSEYRPAITRMFSKGGVINESLKIKYDVYLGHLTKIDTTNLIEWKSEWNKIPKEMQFALDLLYKLNTSIL